MSLQPVPRVRALSFHAEYRCRGSGACCSSGWPIEVDVAVERRLRREARSGRFLLPPGVTSVGSCLVQRAGERRTTRSLLRAAASGRCIFLEADGRCSVHRQLGPQALPAACRQFPRLVTLTPLGVSVSLSLYCPTAARMLVEADAPVRIVESPSAFPAGTRFEGLDAGAALPPLLRPGVLMSWEAHERWEEHAVATLTRSPAPESAIARLAAQADRSRGWSPADGDCDAFLAACQREEPDASRAGGFGATTPTQAWELVAGTVTVRHLLSPPPPMEDESAQRRVEAGWRTQAPVIGRWLAAKAFASWLALQGDGLRTTVRGLALALGVLRAEAARGCRESGRGLDRALLEEALRRADLLLVHLADPQALARRLSRCETSC